MTHSILRPPPGRTLLLAALMVAALLIGHTGTARALTVTVDGTTYELSTINGTYNDNQVLLQSQPWWTGGEFSTTKGLAEEFRDAAFAVSTTSNKTINGEQANY